jgi:hypothetical protein
LQASPLSVGPGYDSDGAGPVAYNPLTEESIRELEWAGGQRSVPFHAQFDDENCTPMFPKCHTGKGAFPLDDDDGFFASTTAMTTSRTTAAVKTAKSFDERARKSVPVVDDDKDESMDQVTCDFQDLRNHIDRFRGASM